MLCPITSVGSNSLWPSGLQPTRFLCPWDYPNKNIGVGYCALLQEISPPRDRTCVSRIAGRFFTAEPLEKPMLNCCVTFIYSLISWLFLRLFSLSFLFFIITHNVAINICVHILLCTYVCSPRPPAIYLEMLRQVVTLCLTSQGLPDCFPKKMNHFTISSTLYKGSNFLRFLSNICCYLSFWLQPS